MGTPACPRCDSGETRKIAESPVKGKFEVYNCNVCRFTWRSTEDLSELNRDPKFWKDNPVVYNYE